MFDFIKKIFLHKPVKTPQHTPIPKDKTFQNNKPKELTDTEIIYIAIGSLSQEVELKQDIEVRALAEIISKGISNVKSTAKELKSIIPTNSLIWPSYESMIIAEQQKQYE